MKTRSIIDALRIATEAERTSPDLLKPDVRLLTTARDHLDARVAEIRETRNPSTDEIDELESLGYHMEILMAMRTEKLLAGTEIPENALPAERWFAKAVRAAHAVMAENWLVAEGWA